MPEEVKTGPAEAVLQGATPDGQDMRSQQHRRRAAKPTLEQHAGGSKRPHDGAAAEEEEAAQPVRHAQHQRPRTEPAQSQLPQMEAQAQQPPQVQSQLPQMQRPPQQQEPAVPAAAADAGGGAGIVPVDVAAGLDADDMLARLLPAAPAGGRGRRHCHFHPGIRRRIRQRIVFWGIQAAAKKGDAAQAVHLAATLV